MGSSDGHASCLVLHVLPWIAGAWLTGLFLGAQWQWSHAPALVAIASLGAVGLALRGNELEARLWVGPLSALALLCGLGVSPSGTARCAVRGSAMLVARVDSVRHGVGDARLRLRLLEGRLVSSGHSLPPGIRLEARVASDRAPPAGSTMRLTAELRPRTELSNPSPHPQLIPRKTGACWARIDERSIEVQGLSHLGRTIHETRTRLRAFMSESLPQDTAGVARALVLGDGAALGYEQRKTVAAAGLAHLFAVSGLHVALVSGTCVRILSWLLRGWALGFDSRRLAAALGIPLTLLHASFAGGSPSAWRAAATAAIGWTIVVLGRRPSSAGAAATAALVLSTPDPTLALRPAFLLSIVATAAILTVPPRTRDLRWGRLRASAAVSARTLIATTPMVWWWFGGVPLVGWITNVVVLPLGSWIVVPLAHLFALAAWIPALDPWVGAALTVAVNALLALCDVFAGISFTKRLPTLDVPQGLVVVASCALLLGIRAWRPRAAVVLVATLCWLAAELALVAREHPRHGLRITFVDVGQGDATWIDFPDGRAALVDTGRGGRHPAARELRELLAARRRRRIDVLVLTHGHPDHYGGLSMLLDEIEIGEIWLNGQLLVEERDASMTKLASKALRRGVDLRFVPDLCERAHHFGSAEVEVLWPCPRYDPALGLNDNSITLRVGLGRRSFLLTGDIEAEAEHRLIEAGRIASSDVLKVAHHGSKTSSSPAIVDAVCPAFAVISSGAGNRYGHPSPSVLARLRAAGARVIRTDIEGGVILFTDGERLELVD